MEATETVEKKPEKFPPFANPTVKLMDSEQITMIVSDTQAVLELVKGMQEKKKPFFPALNEDWFKSDDPHEHFVSSMREPNMNGDFYKDSQTVGMSVDYLKKIVQILEKLDAKVTRVTVKHDGVIVFENHVKGDGDVRIYLAPRVD